MKLTRVAWRSLNDGFSYRVQKPPMNRAFSTSWGSADGNNKNQNGGSSESNEQFDSRIFNELPAESDSSFLQRFNKVQKSFAKPVLDSHILDGLCETLNTLQDGMDGKLTDAASYFEWNPEEVDQEDYSFRPDVNFNPQNTYEPKDLDIRKPGVWKPSKRAEFTVTTQEALRKADFRNVRFLANFLTEAGILIKRSQTGISAKAQRKVAREIKTARAFGLLPFTTMGTKAFQYGRTMESLDADYEYTSYENPAMPDSEFTADPL